VPPCDRRHPSARSRAKLDDCWRQPPWRWWPLWILARLRFLNGSLSESGLSRPDQSLRRRRSRIWRRKSKASGSGSRRVSRSARGRPPDESGARRSLPVAVAPVTWPSRCCPLAPRRCDGTVAALDPPPASRGCASARPRPRRVRYGRRDRLELPGMSSPATSRAAPHGDARVHQLARNHTAVRPWSTDIGRCRPPPA